MSHLNAIQKDWNRQLEIVDRVLLALEPFDGKVIKRLGEKSLATIRAALAEADDVVIPQHVQSPDNVRIDLSGLRELRNAVAENAREAAEFAASEAVAEYNAALAALQAAERRLIEAHGPLGPQRAKQLGAIPALLKY